VAIVYERTTLAAPAVMTVVDQFEQARGTRGAFPAPLGAVRFALLARFDQGNPVALDPLWQLRAETNGNGIFRFRDEATVTGRLPFRVPAQRYRLRIDSDFYQSVETDLDWPAQAGQPPTVLLRPGYAYPFPDLTLPRTAFTVVRGSVFAVGGGPIAVEAASVSITDPPNTWPLAIARTDATGGWALVVPRGASSPPFPATLRVAPPAGSALDIDVTIRPGVENTVAQTALRGAVQTTTGIPIRGALVQVDALSQQAVTDRDGAWAFYFPLDQVDTQVLVTATAPAGQSQSQFVDVIGRATVIVPMFSIPIS
jgi:hypothetical protein